MTTKLFFPVVCLLLFGVCHAQAPSVSACHMVSFGGSLSQGQELKKDIAAGLSLDVWPTPKGKAVRDEGWFIDMVPDNSLTVDYLNFINIPLRESNNRVLGPGYNGAAPNWRNTAEQSLSHPHEMRFLLTKADYDQVSAANDKATFFEGSRKVLEEAGRNYQVFLKLIDSLPTGWLSIRILSYKVDPNTGFPLNIQFQVELSAPRTFMFAPDLNPIPTQCHPSTDH